MQEDKTEERAKFGITLTVSLANSFPIFLFGVLLSLSYWRLSSFLTFLVATFIFLVTRLTRITVDERELSCHSLLQRKLNIKWEDIYSIKPLRTGGCVIRWGKRENKKFWSLSLTAKDTLRIPKGFCHFKQLLNLVINKSVHADIDPQIYQLLEPPDKGKITRLSRRFAIFFFIILGIAVFSIAEFAFSLDSHNFNYFFGFGIVLVVWAIAGCIFSLMLYKWSGEKWLFLSNFYSFCPFFVYLLMFLFLNSNFQLLIWTMLGTVLAMFFTCLLFFLPHLKGKNLLILFLGLFLITFMGGKLYSLNSRVQGKVFKKIDNFHSFGIGWFPDGSRIYVEGYKDSNTDLKEQNIMVFDVSNGKLVKNLTTDRVLSSFSFYWSPDENKLALIEYPQDKPCKLSLLDAKTLQKELLLEREKIILIKHGCWNKNSTKLVGTYETTKSNEKEKKTVVFVIDILSKEIVILQEEDDVISSFWLPDDSVGILTCKTKGKKKKDKLFKYSIIRINTRNFEKEVLYTAKEYCKGAKISPHGSFLLVRSKDDTPMVVDVFGNQEIFIKGKLSGTCTRNIYWAPDESCVLLPLKYGEKNIPAVYDPQNNRLKQISLGADIGSVNWSGDCQWFIVHPKTPYFFPPIFLVSRDRSEIIRVGRGGLLFYGYGQASVNHDGSKVAYYNNTGWFRTTGMNAETTIFLSEIRGKSN